MFSQAEWNLLHDHQKYRGHTQSRFPSVDSLCTKCKMWILFKNIINGHFLIFEKLSVDNQENFTPSLNCFTGSNNYPLKCNQGSFYRLWNIRMFRKQIHETVKLSVVLRNWFLNLLDLSQYCEELDRWSVTSLSNWRLRTLSWKIHVNVVYAKEE